MRKVIIPFVALAALTGAAVVGVQTPTGKDFITAQLGTSAPALTSVTQKSAEAMLAKADHPVIFVLAGDNMKSKAALAAARQAAASHPDVTIVQGDPTDFNAPAAGAVAVFLPEVGFTIQQPLAQTSGDAATYINKRVEFAEKQMAALKKFGALEQQVADKTKDFQGKIADIKAQAQAAVEPIEKQIADLRAQEQAKIAPFKAQFDEVNTQMKAALGTLPKDIGAAQQAVQQLLAEDAASANPKAATVELK